MSLTTYKRAAHYRDQRGLSHRASIALAAEGMLTYHADAPDISERLRELGFSPRQSRRLIKRARQASGRPSSRRPHSLDADGLPILLTSH